MKKFALIFIGLLCCILIVFYTCRQKGEEINSNEIKIGAIIPLTGFSASNGILFKQGMELAINEINKDSSDICFSVQIEDCKSSPKDAYTAFRKLNSQNIQIFAGFGGQFVLGFAPETKDTDKILFASATPNSNLMTLTNRCFRLFPTAEMMTDRAVDFIIEKGFSKIAIVYMQLDSYSMYNELMQNKLIRANKEISFVESYDPNCRDFKNLVNKLSQADVDIIYSAGVGESSALFARQVFDNPKTSTIPIIGDMNFSNSENLKVIGKNTAPIYNIESYMNEKFSQNYYSAFNQSPNTYAVYGYIIPYLLKETYLKLGGTAKLDDIFNYIKNGEFDTAAGKLSFDSKTGEPNLTLIVKTTEAKN